MGQLGSAEEMQTTNFHETYVREFKGPKASATLVGSTPYAWHGHCQIPQRWQSGDQVDKVLWQSLQPGQEKGQRLQLYTEQCSSSHVSGTGFLNNSCWSSW